MLCRSAVVALDVGGTKVACGLVLGGGEILASKTVPTVQISAEASIAQLVSLIDEMVAQAPKDAVAAGAGLVIPGWVDRGKGTVWAPNIAGWDRLPLQDELQRRVALPVILDSDRSGYVRGEAWLGAARGLRDVVFLAVGTGIGAGIMVDGRVVHGHDDLAGAVGWLALDPEHKDNYRRMGCFEAEASGQAIAAKSHAVAGGTKTARQVIEAAAAGDPVAGEILRGAAVYLGMGVANLVSTLNPEMIVLGGGVFRGGAALFEAVRHEFGRWAQPMAAQRVQLELSVLGEKAGLLGAARIALDTCGGNHVV